MIKVAILMLVSMFILSAAGSAAKLGDDVTTTTDPNAIKVTITSAGPMLGPPTNRYHVGEQVPVTINMTNTSTQPAYVCVSDDLYQDLPRLIKDGKVVSYTSWQTYELKSAQKNHTCLHENLPDKMLLMPKEVAMDDSLILADDSDDPIGALAWYGKLTPGHYELSVQRRLGCCDGPMLQSNTIAFDVVP